MPSWTHKEGKSVYMWMKPPRKSVPLSWGVVIETAVNNHNRALLVNASADSNLAKGGKHENAYIGSLYRDGPWRWDGDRPGRRSYDRQRGKTDIGRARHQCDCQRHADEYGWRILFNQG